MDRAPKPDGEHKLPTPWGEPADAVGAACRPAGSCCSCKRHRGASEMKPCEGGRAKSRLLASPAAGRYLAACRRHPD